MNHTQNIFITWQQKQEFWRELLPKSRNSFNLLRIRKRSYRDAKMKKLEQFWRENAVGIGLYNERRACAVVSGAQVKTTSTQNGFVFGASVRWAFELINASGPGIPTT